MNRLVVGDSLEEPIVGIVAHYSGIIDASREGPFVNFDGTLKQNGIQI